MKCDLYQTCDKTYSDKSSRNDVGAVDSNGFSDVGDEAVKSGDQLGEEDLQGFRIVHILFVDLL